MANLRTTYLDPAVLEAMGSMQIRAQSLMEGILSGMHRSPHRGGAVEFAEYVEYSPGHEIRHIDWKAFGKSDKYYVKQYEEETNLRAYMVLDGSGSMNFQSEEAPLTKLRYVAFVAAALSYMLLRQGDAVGALTIDRDGPKYLPAASKRTHLDDLFYLLEGLPGEGAVPIAAALRSVAERARPRSLVFVLSDMLDADGEMLAQLQVLRKRRFEVAVFHAVDPAELTLPYEGLTLFEGLEDDGELLAEPDDLRERYLESFHAHLDRVQAACEENDIRYVRFQTGDPIEEVCLRYLRGIQARQGRGQGGRR